MSIDYSGDETLKVTSCLTDWALPEKRDAGRINTNFDYQAPPPELGAAQSAASAPDPEESGPTAVTRYVAPFNLAFDTQLGLFSWLELPGNEGRLVRFGHGMVGTRQCETKDEILRGTTSG